MMNFTFASTNPTHITNGAMRQKRFAPKTRTGCLTCRARRIKCDETKPTCRNCSVGKRSCEGYNFRKSIILGNERFRMTQPCYDLAKFRIKRPISSFEDPDAIRSWQFYLEWTCGHLSAGPRETRFWKEILPQAAQSHPVLKHAIITAALSDEDVSSTTTSDLYIKPRKLYHYANALHLLNHQQISLDILLLCCIVLFLSSCLDREPDRAKMHMDYGSRIVQEYFTCTYAGTCDLLPEQKETVEKTCVWALDFAKKSFPSIFPNYNSPEYIAVNRRTFTDAEDAVDFLVGVSQHLTDFTIQPEWFAAQLKEWRRRSDGMKQHLPESKYRMVMLFHRLINQVVDLLRLADDQYFKPVRVRTIFLLWKELAQNPTVDMQIRQVLPILLNRVEDGCVRETELQQILALRKLLAQR